MKKLSLRLTALILAVAIFTLLAGCGKEAKVDGEAVFQALLTRVQYDTELSDAGKNADLFFPDLPQGSQIRLFSGSGYYADELAMLTLPEEGDRGAGVTAVRRHLDELRNHFMNYAPEELGKLDKAVIYENSNFVILCITPDYAGAQAILENPQELPSAEPYVPSEAPSEETPVPSDSQAPSQAPQTETSTEPSEPAQPQSYPTLKSQSGTYHSYGNGFIRVDDHAFEGYGYVSSAADRYASLVNQVADQLAGKTTVYDLPIPTAMGIVLPDDIKEQFSGYTDQGPVIEEILGRMGDNVTPVNVYSNMMMHRDEYLYFRSDYHWNGRGAYYAYEAFCGVKGVEPYTLREREAQTFGNYLGALYMNNTDHDPVLAQNPDTVEAFLPHSASATLEITDRDGQTYPWSIIADVSDWDQGTKYCTFAGADSPFAVFQNPEVTDGSVLVIVKESYGNALLPYLVDHYSTVYEIDYRYWNGNLVDFVLEKEADDLIFANNLSMIGSDYLIGMLAEIIS